MIKAITPLLIILFLSVNPANLSAFDNSLVPAHIRMYKAEPTFTIGASFANGGNPGYYDSNGDPVAEQTFDFDSADSIIFKPEFLLLYRDTLDKTDLLWDTEYYQAIINIAFSYSDFDLFAKLPITFRTYSEKVVGVQYDPSINNNLNVIRKAEFAYDLPSTSRIETIDLGARWTFFDTEKIKLFTMPTGSISLLEESDGYFGNLPSEINLPIGIDYLFDKTGLQAQAGYVLREGAMSDQIRADATLYFTNVNNTILFLDVRFLQSLDESEEFVRFTEPISPTYFTVAPGFTYHSPKGFSFFVSYRVDIYNKSNYGMSRFDMGINWGWE
jgi:hypothetical protein